MLQAAQYARVGMVWSAKMLEREKTHHWLDFAYGNIDKTASECSEICSPETMKEEDETMKRIDWFHN